ncbi:MAG TPA: translation elongation factor Ts [Candidatus Saccharimonadia bacterium]|nr:translation elongation factor Ts [Candidatus Saccharimonadia bacterium]
MDITATMVKELRERSGAGMMECKKALTENQGNLDASIEWLRKQGLAKADKKASRVAAEGRIVHAQEGKRAVLVEVNSETDFVAKDENFMKFAGQVATAAAKSGSSDVDALKGAKLDGGTIDEARQALVAKVGENVQVRRMVAIDAKGTVASYVHGGRIGVIVELEGGNEELAKGIAMHVAAMNPPYISAEHVPSEIVAKEKEIALAQVKESDRSKPAEILEKITSGKVRKVIGEMTLVGQPYVMDQNTSVEDVLKKAGAKVVAFHRLAVGEGIEKKEEDFAAEVMKQAGLA